jgi:rRNA maturation endonuclease Nob1
MNPTPISRYECAECSATIDWPGLEECPVCGAELEDGHELGTDDGRRAGRIA